MAFTGTPVVKQTTDRKVRITGPTLAADATGTIGLFGDTGADIQLPEAFEPKPSSYNGADLALADVIEARTPIPTTDVTAPVPISVSKGGTPFRISYHNDLAGGGATSGLLELWIERTN